MTFAFLRNTTAFIVALIGAALVGGAAPASGASITYSDPACASFTVTGSGGNYTLVCSKLACSIGANPSSPLPLATGTTLTASCSPNAQGYSYSWTAAAANAASCPGVNSASSTAQIAAAGAAAAGCVYQVDVNGGNNGNGTATTSLTWQSAAPQRPTGCTITPSPQSLPAGGGTVNLVAACTGGDPVSNFDWTSTAAGFPKTGASVSANITALTAFTVVASNSGGSTTATTSVQVGGSAGSNPCQGFNRTMSYTWNWANGPMTINTYNDPQGPIGPDGIIVIEFTPLVSLAGSAGTISIAPFPPPYQPTTRTTTISSTRCKLDEKYPAQHIGTDVGGTFTVGVWNTRLYPPLVAGQKYYINISARNAAGESTCFGAGSACDVRVQLSMPAKP